ncbi:MAG: RtcB family protein [Bradymonadaceae bacterium]
MKGYQLEALGVPPGKTITLALKLVGKAIGAGLTVEDAQARLERIVESPMKYHDDEYFGAFARALGDRTPYAERGELAPWAIWGEGLDSGALQQMENASRLPIAHRGALMPDAHRGYGLPIGGVLATEGAVIPFAVGVDIACRMKLSVLDIPVDSLKDEISRLGAVLEGQTRFGMGSCFECPHDHPVMDRDWEISPVTRRLKDRARHQLGSSGSGNHFVEFGLLTLTEDELDLKAGTYLALLSHSGSRGAGANVANHFSKLAESLHPELPRELRHLAWLDLDSEAGQEYWAAMELMGEYASANHAVIHREIVAALGARVLTGVENHHNFAWKEIHDDREVIVHRKGATPAGDGVLGVIPGSMADPGFVVRGKGNALSLESAAHGAGRRMSRRQANRELDWTRVQQKLDDRGVTLLSAGLDEAPFAYKDIEEVMSHQDDLVHIVARFDPKIVKMAAPGEPPED